VHTVGAQTLPDLGDAAQADLSPAQERKLGEAIIRQVRAAGAYGLTIGESVQLLQRPWLSIWWLPLSRGFRSPWS
jgi:hypothetical protein